MLAFNKSFGSLTLSLAAIVPALSQSSLLPVSSGPSLTESTPDSLPDAPVALVRREPKPPLAVASHTLTFSTIALALTFGDGGIGGEIATPLNSRINLRAGGGFLVASTHFVADTIPFDGTIHLGNAHASVDWFLFHNAFHISPGITFYNVANFNAAVNVPGNQSITINDTVYVSDPADPIQGSAFINFGHRLAPRLTIGHGNMIPHRDKNWTFPYEIGFDYRHVPTVAFTLGGSSCQNVKGCDLLINDPDVQSNLAEERKELTDDLAPLRFFPIVQFGVSYKFGH